MKPIGQLHSKTSPILGNRSLLVLDTAGVCVPLVKEIVKTGGNVEISLESPGKERQVRDQEAAQVCLRERSSPAKVLGFEACKHLLPNERNAEMGLGESVGRIGQHIPGLQVPRGLQRMGQFNLHATRPPGP